MVDAQKTGVRIFDNGRKKIDKSQIELQNDERIATQQKLYQGTKAGIKKVLLQIEAVGSFPQLKSFLLFTDPLSKISAAFYFIIDHDIVSRNFILHPFFQRLLLFFFQRHG